MYFFDTQQHAARISPRVRISALTYGHPPSRSPSTLVAPPSAPCRKVAPTTRENEQPTPPVTASSSGSSDCHHDFDLPVKCHQQSTRRRDDDAETPVCKVVLPGKHAVAPLSPKAKLPPAGGTTAVADKIGSVEVAEWVWSRDLQPLQKKSGGRQAGRYQRCKAAAVVAVATEKTGGDSSKIGKKLLLVDDLPWTFGSVCRCVSLAAACFFPTIDMLYLELLQHYCL